METQSDDIPDPVTPAAVLAAVMPSAVPDGFDLSLLKDQCLLHVHEAMEGLTDDVRMLIAQAAAPTHYHEEVQVSAVSPQGFTVRLTTRKATPPEMLEAMTKILDWLQANQYQPG